MSEVQVSWRRVNDKLTSRARRDRERGLTTSVLGLALAEQCWQEARRAITEWVAMDGSLNVVTKLIAEASGYRASGHPGFAVAAEACAECVLLSVAPVESTTMSVDRASNDLIAMMRVAIGAALAIEFATSLPGSVHLTLVDLGASQPVAIETRSGPLFDYDAYQRCRETLSSTSHRVDEMVASAVVELLDGDGPLVDLDRAIRTQYGSGLADIVAVANAIKMRLQNHDSFKAGQAFAATVPTAVLVSSMSDIARQASEAEISRAITAICIDADGGQRTLSWRPWHRFDGRRLATSPVVRGVIDGVDTLVVSPELLSRTVTAMLGYAMEGQWFLRIYAARSHGEQAGDLLSGVARQVAQLIDRWYEDAVGSEVAQADCAWLVEVAVDTERKLVGADWTGPDAAQIREGDIDVLVLDPSARVLTILECKHHHSKFRPADISRLLRDCFEGEKSYVAKVERRHMRAERDLALILAARGLEYGPDWRVRSALVTRSDSPLLFWRESHHVAVVSEDRLVEWLTAS